MNDMHLISLEAEARRYCDRHDIKDQDSCQRVLASMRHRAFLEAIEPINARKRQCLNVLMIARPPVMIMHQNGRLEQMPFELPPELKKIFAELDELIILEAQRWGCDTSQLRR